MPVACLQKAVSFYKILCFKVDASGPPEGWHVVPEPFQDLSTVATQSVANMTDIGQGEVAEIDMSEL